MAAVFGPSGVPVTSTKGVTGHALGAAGALELAAVLLSFEQRLIPPTAGTEKPDPDFDIDLVLGEARPWTPGPTMSNNFGFGGHNGSVIVRPAELTIVAPVGPADRPRRIAQTMHEHQVALAGGLAVEHGLAAALAGARRQAAHLHGQLEGVAGADLAAEAGAVETAEQRQLAGVALVGEHGDRADLGDGLAHQHAGQRRAAGEVAGEEPLVAGEVPAAGGARRRARARRSRRRTGTAAGAGGWPTARAGRPPQSPSAASSLSGVSFGLILYQACSTVPSSSMRNAERSMPMYVLP